MRIFPHAPHLETIIPASARSQVEDHLSEGGYATP